LQAIRDALASELEVAAGSVAASLARELRAVLAEIAALPDEKVSTPLDVIVASVASLDEYRRSRHSSPAGS
jgi:hypothetical protein